MCKKQRSAGTAAVVQNTPQGTNAGRRNKKQVHSSSSKSVHGLMWPSTRHVPAAVETWLILSTDLRGGKNYEILRTKVYSALVSMKGGVLRGDNVSPFLLHGENHQQLMYQVYGCATVEKVARTSTTLLLLLLSTITTTTPAAALLVRSIMEQQRNYKIESSAGEKAHSIETTEQMLILSSINTSCARFFPVI